MKTLIVTLSLICFFVAGYAQDTTKTVSHNKPKATYQVGAAKVLVWENKNADGTTWKNFTVEKIYQKDGEWKTAHSFNDKELLELKAALDKAISEENIKVK